VGTKRARELRKSMTKAEVRLWVRHKGVRAEGVHFRRQAPFRGYYLDFVCFSRRLVVELDGWRHAEVDGHAADEIRNAVLRREGFRVLRFWNHQLDQAMSDVIDTIQRALAESPTLAADAACPSP